jgi:hypothetical protein
MKKVLIFILMIVPLSGCTEKANQEAPDYQAIYDEYYADVAYNPSEEFDICKEDADGNVVSHVEISYVLQFGNFTEMVENEYAKFVYGEIYNTESFNCISESVYMMVYSTEFPDQRELIRIAHLVDQVSFANGVTYLLNLTYNEDNDVYFLSQQNDSIFKIRNDGTISGAFFFGEYPRNIDAFIEEIFE